MALKKGGLGKGIDTLFAENESEDSKKTLVLKISEIEPNRDQPRREFDESTLSQLADSISLHGLLQPILVRPIIGGGYQIVAGERRWRACKMAGLTQVPVVIRELNDHETMELALIENLQRDDLNPIEEATGYRKLIDKYDMTQEEVAKVVGKSRPTIANALRLLSLPTEIQNLVNNGRISAGHARALLSFKDEKEMEKASKIVATQDISVRELENMAKKSNKLLETVKDKLPKKKMPYFSEVEIALTEHLGRKIKVNGSEKKGVLEIEFYGRDDLDAIIKIIEDLKGE